MRKCKKLVSFLLIISVLLAAVFGNLFLGQASASAKEKKNVKSVTVMLRGKNITKKTITLVKGKTAKLTVKTNMVKAKSSVKFSSNKKSVATVSKKGTVKAKKAGTAKIKVTIAEKYKKKVTWVRIKVKDAEKQTDSPSALSKPSDTEEPSATAEPSLAETPTTPTTEPSAAETSAQPSGGKVLVAYFSRTGENYGVGVIEKGNTAVIADMIAEQTGGTEFEIATVNPYPDVYSECTAVASRKCYEVCRKYHKPVIVMEPCKGGNLTNLPEDARSVFEELQQDDDAEKASNASYAIRFAAGFEGIMMVLSGVSNMEQMEDNISFMKDFQPLTDREMEAVHKVCDIFRSKNMIPCTACRYCTDGCPKKISIPDLFACLNAKKVFQNWNTDYYYNNVHTVNNGKASECIKCGKCEAVCLQHLHIRELLKDVAEEFEGA